MCCAILNICVVMFHSVGYPLSLTVTYSMSSAYHTLVLGKRPLDFITSSNCVNLLKFKTLSK